MRLTDRGRLQIPGLDLDVRPYRLAPGEGVVVTAPPLETTISATPSPPSLGDLADVEVLVRVMGEVEVVRLTPGSPTDAEERLVPTRQKGLEAVVYLAMHGGADREELEIALFPEGVSAAKTIYNTIGSARALVGAHLFPATPGRRYELSDRVVTDYSLLTELAAQGHSIDDVEVASGLLTQALDLVRGEPFTGSGQRFAWAGPQRGTIRTQIADAAETLAELRLAQGDWRTAEWAARRGVQASPGDERMYRLLMRAAHTAGNRPGVRRVFQELSDVVANPDMGIEPQDILDPQTVTLLDELTDTGSATAAGEPDPRTARQPPAP
jgi:DNA-binding SARP family transcriptional activator